MLGLFTGWMLSALSMLPAPCGAGSMLHVYEEDATSLSPDVVIGGLRALSHGRALLWLRTPSEVRIMNVDLGIEAEWQIPEHLQPIVTADVMNDTVTLVSAGRAGVYNLTGHHESRISQFISRTILDADASDSGWVILMEADDGVVSTFVLGEGHTRVPLGPRQYGSVRAIGGGRWLVTRTYPPFEATLIGQDEQVIWSRPISDGEALGLGDSGRQWAALAPVILDRGILITLADLASDLRKVVRMNGDIGLVSVYNIDAAIGFLSSYPEECVLWAVRDVNGIEVVRYRWRWRH